MHINQINLYFIIDRSILRTNKDIEAFYKENFDSKNPYKYDYFYPTQSYFKKYNITIQEEEEDNSRSGKMAMKL